MTSNLSAIFSRFYLKITDYHLAGLEEDVAQELLGGYLRSAISRPMIRRLFSSVAILPAETIITEDDEEVQLEERLEYEMLEPLDDSDGDFIENVLVTGMIVEWLDPQVYSVLNTAQFFGNSEQKLVRCIPTRLVV